MTSLDLRTQAGRDALTALTNAPSRKPRTTRRETRGDYHTRCVACSLVFTTRAAEDRHVTAGHGRFEVVL